MEHQLSNLTQQENKRLQNLIVRRLEHIDRQLELYQVEYPRSTVSDLITHAYRNEKEELLTIKEKLIGGRHENKII